VRVALVLGAGGYVGWPFQMAVLSALERELGADLRASELVVGTSVGAMSGVLLRAGFHAGDVLDHMEGRPLRPEARHLLHEVLDPPGVLPPRMPGWRPPAARSTRLPTAWWSAGGPGTEAGWAVGALAGMAPRGRVDHGVFGRAADSLLPVWPGLATWVVAVRASDGERVVFGRDTHATAGVAVTASSAIPGYFAPVLHDGEAHVDAGVRSSTHADLVADVGDLDLVVVVPPLAVGARAVRAVDLPLRWLVNRQVAREVALLEDWGHRVVVARPPADVVRAMQGDPVRVSDRRIQRTAALTRRWASGWAGPAIEAAVANRRREADRDRS
jgi:NTE family protein